MKHYVSRSIPYRYALGVPSFAATKKQLLAEAHGGGCGVFAMAFWPHDAKSVGCIYHGCGFFTMGMVCVSCESCVVCDSCVKGVCLA